MVGKTIIVESVGSLRRLAENLLLSEAAEVGVLADVPHSPMDFDRFIAPLEEPPHTVKIYPHPIRTTPKIKVSTKPKRSQEASNQKLAAAQAKRERKNQLRLRNIP
jgi:hypothetical protein